MITKERVLQIVEEILKDSDKYITSIKVMTGNRIKISIDSDTVVGINDCADINKKLEKALDRDKEDFDLEISSHGLTESIVLPRQFKKHIGKTFDITLKNGEKIIGTLLEFNEQYFTIESIQNNKKSEKPNIIHKIEYMETKKIIINLSQLKLK